jgi:hypothetical protein
MIQRKSPAFTIVLPGSLATASGSPDRGNRAVVMGRGGFIVARKMLIASVSATRCRRLPHSLSSWQSGRSLQ